MADTAGLSRRSAELFVAKARTASPPVWRDSFSHLAGWAVSAMRATPPGLRRRLIVGCRVGDRLQRLDLAGARRGERCSASSRAPSVVGPRLPVAAVLATAALVAAGAIAASPARGAVAADYLVVAIDELGMVEPLFLREVEVAELPESLSADALDALERSAAVGDWSGEGGGETELLTFRLAAGAAEAAGADSAAGGERAATYRGAVALPRFVRGEHHGGPLAGGGWAIDAHRFVPERRVAALRLPRRRGATLELGGVARAGLGPLDRLEMDDLRARAATLPLARFQRLRAPKAAVRWQGSPANRVNLLLLGEGYTSAETTAFESHAAALAAELLAIPPYADYAGFVDVARLLVPSAQSGADHPPYQAGCASDDPTCCADAAAQSDPRAGTFVDTALGSRYCAFNIHRLLVADAAATLAAAAAVPDWDRVLVVVNDPTYGGSGGFFLVTSTHPSAIEVARHEYGHSFTDLADEYESPYPGFPPCSDRGAGGAPCEANVTDETARALVKWEPWIAPATPVPTPEGGAYGDAVGLFEGARYLETGIYRPRESACLMRALGQPFCEVCRQEYVLALYRGGWGVPAGGIDLIEPGSERPPPGPVVAGGGGVTLAATLLPTPQPPRVRWTVDGAPVAGASGAAFRYVPSDARAHEVELRVEDATPFVHPELAGNALASSRRWTVTGGAAGCVADAHTLCLLAGRYRVTVEWQNQYSGASGRGQAIPQGDFTGFFAFDDRANVELIVKLLDFGDVVKLFYGQLTDLGFTLTVTDTQTGAERRYANGPGNCGAIDQAAFPKVVGAAGANGGDAAGGGDPPAAAAPCTPGPETLCLLASRFRVEVAWRNQFSGQTGAGAAQPLSDLTGLFTFTDPRNVEILTKVLDFGDRILFIYGSLSDLEYTIRVTDTASGVEKTYFNPAGTFCGAIDPTAF